MAEIEMLWFYVSRYGHLMGHNGPGIPEYEAFWLMSFPQVNP